MNVFHLIQNIENESKRSKASFNISLKSEPVVKEITQTRRLQELNLNLSRWEQKYKFSEQKHHIEFSFSDILMRDKFLANHLEIYSQELGYNVNDCVFRRGQ